MTDLASHPPQSPRFRRDLPTLERRAGAWLRDFNTAAARPDFTIPGHLAALTGPEPLGRDGRDTSMTMTSTDHRLNEKKLSSSKLSDFPLV
ncbi:MAG: hypothetical protein NTV46_01780 [Verrucomicrobia bacterium]|nr:hypothetical protein [Verrucomicrobiota bacterium]